MTTTQLAIPLETHTVTRYVTPLREGGSLPAIVEADDGEMYVIKFVGAGQGPKALIAEVIAGELARHLGFNMPQLAFLELDEAISRSEPHEEIQDLLRASVGLNLGMRYLPNAFTFNLLLKPPPTAQLASDIVWFDAFVTNVDRTVRNVNLLLWQDDLWLIDHGAALYFHHDWDNYLARSETPFALIKDHTLLSFASQIEEADARLKPQITPDLLWHIVNQIPDVWLGREALFSRQAEHRTAYVNYLLNRLSVSNIFVREAVNARKKLV